MLCLRTSAGETGLALKPRDRDFVAALAVPRALAEGGPIDAANLPVLSSQEITDRTNSHRAIITRALGDLEQVFADHELALDDYVTADKQASRYGLSRVRVDVVELLRAADAPDEVDALLRDVTDR